MDKNSSLQLINETKRYIVEKLFVNAIDIQEIGREEITIEDVFFKLTDKKSQGGNIDEPSHN